MRTPTQGLNSLSVEVAFLQPLKVWREQNMSEWQETMWKRKAAPYAKFCEALCGAQASAAIEKSLMGPAKQKGLEEELL